MQNRKHKYTMICMVLVIGTVLGSSVGLSQEVVNVPDNQKRFFKHYVDKRSYKEQFLNLVGLTSRDVGRSFALIAGVSHYPNMSTLQKDLKPAAEDLARLEDYLKTVEFFDEIVVLQDIDVSLANLRFFLQKYFPERLKQFPKSRFLFAYSGHGFNEGTNSYLLESGARSLQDRANSINVANVKVWVDEVVEAGHQVLVLLNSCYSGAFLKRSFGGKHFIPKYAGAHAITAGGTKEQAWHDPAIGPGSIFFEKLFAGLEGRADSLPVGGDGVVTVDELASYLKYEVQVSTDQTQNPQFGDISKNGSLGGFFFLNRLKPVEAGMLKAWNPTTSFGEKATSADRERGSLTKSTIIAKGPAYQAPTSLPKTITGKDGAAMVLIPGGTFWMGSTADEVEAVVKECVGYDFEEEECRGWFKDEVPRHKVSLPAFYMDTVEVSNRLFREFSQVTKYQTTAEREGDAYAFVEGKGWEIVKGASWRKPESKEEVFASNRADHPVVSVSWDDASAYCDKYGKRLPTEAEWEYAARAGTATRNWWGNAPPGSRRVANIADMSTKDLLKNYLASYDDGFTRTAPVGTMVANPWGLFDMIGNVAEWTADWYGEGFYSPSATSSPRGPSTGDYRVRRGGSWKHVPFYARSAFRNWDSPTFRYDVLGFRCVQDVP